MSVFKKLKGSFQSAHQDIIGSLRALTSDGLHRGLAGQEINLDAGADLMHKFRYDWFLIRSETKDSAHKAEEVATVLAPLFKTWEKSAEFASHLEQEAKAISNILGSLAKMHTLLENLRQDFQVVEKELDVLENVCKEQNFNNKCLEEIKKLSVYTAKKISEEEKIKASLAHQYAKKVAAFEGMRRSNLQDRSEAFTSAFQDDVKYYQKHGHPDKFPGENSRVASLSNVELDQDLNALDSFLDSTEEQNSSGNLELSGEGAYFEDDYITDYSCKQTEHYEANLTDNSQESDDLGHQSDTELQFEDLSRMGATGFIPEQYSGYSVGHETEEDMSKAGLNEPELEEDSDLAMTDMKFQVKLDHSQYNITGLSYSISDGRDKDEEDLVVDLTKSAADSSSLQTQRLDE